MGALAVAFLGSVAAAPALATDCPAPDSDIAKIICGSVQARTAVEDMGRFVDDLAAQLDEDGRAILRDGQQQWTAWRNDTCGVDAECLAEKTGDRAFLLSEVREGMVPFFAWQKGSMTRYDVVLQGSRFSGSPGAGEAAYGAWLDERLAETPMGEEFADAFDTSSPWWQELTVEVTRLNSRMISAIARTYDYSGGAHPNSWTAAATFDRKTGALFDPASVFTEEARASLAADCTVQIVTSKADFYGENTAEAVKQFEEVYAGTVPASIADAKRWRFTNGGGVVQFDTYAVGPHSDGPTECVFPDETIRSLARDPGLFETDE